VLVLADGLHGPGYQAFALIPTVEDHWVVIMSDQIVPKASEFDERFVSTDSRNPDYAFPPPPGIERQWFQGVPGQYWRNRKREYELAAERLMHAAGARDFATAKHVILWLWRWQEITTALNRDVEAELKASLPGLRSQLKVLRREKRDLEDAHGIDETYRRETIEHLQNAMLATQRAIDSTRPVLHKAARGRPTAPTWPDDLITAFATMLAVRRQYERSANYREIKESLETFGLRDSIHLSEIKEAVRRVRRALAKPAGGECYPVSAGLYRRWWAELERIRPRDRAIFAFF
jgi:hypothetical protein